MEQKIYLRSKLVDGLLAAGVLVLLDVLVMLFVKPILVLFDRPGILVYAVMLVAVSAICLERAMSSQDPETTRVWWGILGGFSAWEAVKFADWLGSQAIINETGMVNLILALLIASIVWRKANFVGLRYFMLVFFIGWLSHVGLGSIVFFSSYLPQFSTLVVAIGILFGLIMGIAILYIFVRSQTRMDRLNAALVIWFSAMMIIYVFRGGLV